MVISRVVIRVTPFRAIITLLITYLLSPLPLQVGDSVEGLGIGGFPGLGVYRGLGQLGMIGFRV